MRGLLDRRLVLVTGKGGVGKTTVAAALGQLASARGKRVLVCEVEPKGDLAVAYECGPTTFVPREVVDGLYAMSIDTEASLREYLRLHLRLPTVGRLGPLAGMLDFVANAAPGVRELVTVGKLCYEVRERRWDLVIADASATGHIVGQLAAPVGINELVKVGAIRQQTDWMLEILEDPERTGVCIVTTPEEMPVNEAVDLARRLGSETHVDLATVIANRVLPELFGRGEEAYFDQLEGDGGPAALSAALGRSPAGTVASVLDAARLAVQIRRRGAGHLERLRDGIDPAVPICYVPYLFGRAHGPRAIHQVAAALRDEFD